MVDPPRHRLERELDVLQAGVGRVHHRGPADVIAGRIRIGAGPPFVVVRETVAVGIAGGRVGHHAVEIDELPVVRHAVAVGIPGNHDGRAVRDGLYAVVGGEGHVVRDAGHAVVGDPPGKTAGAGIERGAAGQRARPQRDRIVVRIGRRDREMVGRAHRIGVRTGRRERQHRRIVGRGHGGETEREREGVGAHQFDLARLRLVAHVDGIKDQLAVILGGDIDRPLRHRQPHPGHVGRRRQGHHPAGDGEGIRQPLLAMDQQLRQVRRESVADIQDAAVQARAHAVLHRKRRRRRGQGDRLGNQGVRGRQFPAIGHAVRGGGVQHVDIVRRAGPPVLQPGGAVGHHRTGVRVDAPGALLFRLSAGIGHEIAHHLAHMPVRGPQPRRDHAAANPLEHRRHVLVVEPVFRLAIQVGIEVRRHRGGQPRRRGGPGIHPRVERGQAALVLRDLGKVHQIHPVGAGINVAARTPAAQVVVVFIVECGLEDGGMEHFARQALHIGVGDPGHSGPGVGHQPAGIQHAVGCRVGHARPQQEFLRLQAFPDGAAYVPVVVLIGGGMIDPVVRLLAAGGVAPVDGFPCLSPRQGDIALRNVFQRHQLHPGMVRVPAHVLVVGIGLGQRVELLPHAEDRGDLVLGAAAGAPVEQFPQGNRQPVVVVGEPVVVRRVVDHEAVHAVDLVDAVAVIAQRHRAAVPVPDVRVLVDQRIAEAQVEDLAEGAAVQHPFRRPEHGIAVDVRAVDAVQRFRRQGDVVAVEGIREVRKDVVRISAAHQRDHVGRHQCPDLAVQAGPGAPGVGLHLRPLQRRGQRRRHMQVQRHLVDAVDLDRPLVAGARAVVDNGVDVAARLDGLVSVRQQRDLGGLPAVVVRAAPDPLRQDRVRNDVVLVAPVIGAQPVVADDVAGVDPAADVAGAQGTVAGTILGGEHLEVQGGGHAVPARRHQVAAVDGELHGIQFGIVIGPQEPAGHGGHAGRGQAVGFRQGVVGGIAVHIQDAALAVVHRHRRFPLHGRAAVHVVGQRGLARAGAVEIDQDIDVQRALLGVGLQILEVDAEVDLVVRHAAVAHVEGHHVPGGVIAVPAPVDVHRLAAAVVVIVEGDQVIQGPVRELLVVRHAVDRAERRALPHRDEAVFRRLAAFFVIRPRIGAVLQFHQVGEGVAVGIARGAVLRAGDDRARAQVGRAYHAGIQRIQAVAGLPAVRQAVAIGVRVQRIGFLPQFAGVPHAVGVRIPVDAAVVVLVFAITVAQAVAIGVRLVRIGFRPVGVPLAGRPVAFEPGFVGDRQTGAVAVHPAIAVGILDPVRNAVVVRVGIGRIRGAAVQPGRAVAAGAGAGHAGHPPVVVQRVVEWRIEIRQEVLPAVAVGVGIRVGVGMRPAPAHFQPVRQAVGVAVGAFGQAGPAFVADQDVAVGPGIRIGLVARIRVGKPVGQRHHGILFRVDHAVVVMVEVVGGTGIHHLQELERHPARRRVGFVLGVPHPGRETVVARGQVAPRIIPVDRAADIGAGGRRQRAGIA